MKIALISTAFFGVFPPRYGGLELVIGLLARGLVKRGHKVVLIAPDESQDFEGGFVYRTGPALDTVKVNWIEEEQKMWTKYNGMLDDFDIVEGNNWFGFEYASKRENPSLKVCHRHHGHLNYEWWGKTMPPFKLNMIAISHWMKHCYETGYDGRAPTKIPTEVCYNGIELSDYPYQKDKGGRLLFLGRIDPIKGVHTAIEVAEQTHTPIDIVGATSFVANRDYVSQTELNCSKSKYATFIGEVSHADKVRYLQNARALIAASTFMEPFGLHFVEANSCGTPVISLDDGAAKEVIEDKVTGFICKSINEMVESINKIESINPKKCRERVEKNFTKEKMAMRAEQLYKKILNGQEW